MARTRTEPPRPIRPEGLPNTDGIMRPSTRGKRIPEPRPREEKAGDEAADRER